MRRLEIIVVFIVAIFGSFSSFGQYTGYRPLQQGSDLRDELVRGSRAIQTIACNFKQEKHLSVLQETIFSEGLFRYKRDNRVRLEYTKPFHYLLLMNGDQMVVRDENKETRMSTKTNKLFRQINRIIVDCVQGTILDNPDFSNRFFESESSDLLELTPTSQALKDFFEAIVVIVDRKDYSVRSIDLREPGGDHTVLRFTEKELNGKLDDSLFSH